MLTKFKKVLRNGLDYGIHGVIALTFLLGPIMVFPGMAYNYVNSKSFIFEVGFAFIIAYGIIRIPFSDIKQFARSRVSMILGAFLVVMIIATIFSIDPTLSWLSHLERGTGTFFVLLAAIGSWFTVLITQKSGLFREVVLYPLAIAGAVLGLSIILGPTGFNVLLWPVITSSEGGGLTGNTSFSGSLVMLISFVLVYLFMTARSQKEKAILIGLAVFTILNPVIVGYGFLHGSVVGVITKAKHTGLIGDARGAVVSLVLGMLVVLGIKLAYAENIRKKIVGKVLVGVICLITTISLVLLVIPGSRIHSFYVNSDSGTRFLYWGVALQSIKAHPILGTGPETFRYADEKYFNPEFFRKTYGREIYADKPHNAFLEILVTTGIIGFLVYGALIVMTIAALVRIGRKKEKATFVAVMSGLLFAYLLNNFILFDIAGTYVIFFLVLAWVAFEEREELGHTFDTTLQQFSRNRIISYLVAGGIILAVLSVVVTEAQKLRIILTEMFAPVSDRMSLYMASEDISSFGSGISICQRVDGYSQTYQSHVDQIIKRDPTVRQEATSDILALENSVEITLKHHPENIQCLISLARLYNTQAQLVGKYDDETASTVGAIGTLVEQLSPGNPQGYWIVAKVYQAQGRLDEAAKVLQHAIDLDPRVVDSYQTMMAFALATNNTQLYQKTLQSELQNVSPTDR